MAKGETWLQAKACARWGKELFEGVKNGFQALFDVIKLDFDNIGDAFDMWDDSIVGQAYQYFTEDPFVWVHYMGGLAAKGQLLASAAYPEEWYAATHKHACSAKRTTTSAAASKSGYNLGILLASPTIREKNPTLSVDMLKALESQLNDQGMKGLAPVMPHIIKGFKAGVVAWNPASEPPSSGLTLGSFRDRKFKGKFRDGDTPSTNLVAVIAGGLTGFLLAGPLGAVAGGYFASLLKEA